MAYLQPWMLWALPVVLLPIIIHLLNRLRYKTVHWAAMIFLLKANRAATRRAKIRQYILLALRCLLLLFLIWAMARPLIGGWIGSAAGGAPEAVILLLDRSASMEAHAGQTQESKRAHALALLTQAARQSIGSRFILIENVLRQPLEIADASSLATMQICEPTDTAADLPAMFRAALDYLTRNKPGSAEVWVASDLQASNWRPESPEWQDIAARFNGLPQSVRVRILDLFSPGNNVSLNVKSAAMRVRDEKTGQAQLNLMLELKAEGVHKGSLPLLLTRDGAKSQVDVPLTAAMERQNLKFDLPKIEPGWGEIELPADDNPADNTAYFAYAPPVPLRAVIVADGASGPRLRLAAAPDKTRTYRVAEILPAAQAGAIAWKDTAFIVWAAPAPEASIAKSLQGWVESGGVLLCLPLGGEGGAGRLGTTWSAVEDASKIAPFRVTAWDDIDGPLARTDSGTPLPLAKLEIARRQIPSSGETAHSAGAFADGRPFLLARKMGSGQVFACATLPEAEWGNFGDGFFGLLPMMQRLLALGGQRLAPPMMATAGEWQPADAQETWTAIETDRRRDWRWHAGVYRNGAHLVALNRPESEDTPEIVERTRLPELLHGVKLTLMAGAIDLKVDQLQSEIWPAMLMLTMLFMCAEMALATSKAMLPVKPGAKSAPPRSPVSPKPAEVAA